MSISTQRIVLTQGSRVPKKNTVPPRFTAGYFLVRHGSLCSPKTTWWEPTPFFGHHVNSWFFSNRCPDWHFRKIPLVQNFQRPGSQHVPLSVHTNSPPLCQVPLWFITRQSTLFLLVYTYMLWKCSSLILLRGFLPSGSECWLKRFSLFFPRKELFGAGTSHAEDKKRTTQLCWRWLSNSRSHSACIQTTLIDGNQLLFSVTKLILLTSSIIAEVNALERFLENKI